MGIVGTGNGKRVRLMLGTLIAGFALYGILSIRTLNQLKVNGPLYERIVQSKDLIADVLPPPEYVIESYLVSLQLAGAPDQARKDKLRKRLYALQKEYLARHAFWQRARLERELAHALLTQAHEPAMEFFRLVFEELVPAVDNADASAASRAVARIHIAYERHRQAVDTVVEMLVQRAAADEAQARDMISASLWSLHGILLLFIGAGVCIAFWPAKMQAGPGPDAP